MSNGFLKSNNLEEITEVYMGDLVGEKVYDTYGLEFPVLVKFIDAHDVLSVQVHPDDGLARERHGSRGKTVVCGGLRTGSLPVCGFQSSGNARRVFAGGF